MNWLHDPLLTPAHGAYAIVAILIISGLAWVFTRREPIDDPIEDEYPEPRPFPNQRKDKRS